MLSYLSIFLVLRLHFYHTTPINDIRETNNTIAIYIDVKTLYDGATPSLFGDSQLNTQMEKEIVKYLIYKNFLKEILEKTKEEFKSSLKNAHWLKRTSNFFQGKELDVHKELDEISVSIGSVFQQIDSSLLTKIKNSHEANSEISDNFSGTLSGTPSFTAQMGETAFESFKKEFDSTIMRYLDIKNCLINNFLKIKSITGLKYLYIYLDDYSEIEEKAQELFMDWFVAPLNNLSEDFIKFKIATYPNRFYSGKLDSQKYDQLNLDFYSALSTYKDISKMEEIATDYVKRLIENRFEVYLPNKSIKDYFEITENALWDLLFEVSLNNPRKIGYILSYCYETYLAQDKKITAAAISAASVRYFDEVIKKYFESNKYVQRSFEDVASIENQKELLDKFVKKQVENKISINKSDAKKFTIPSPPTSHFFIANDLANLLDTLELNGYVTTYNKLNDKVNTPSTLFALDYGLCRKHNLSFGRPKDTRLRKYYNDHRFIFSTLVKDHFNNSQVIVCEKGHEFPFEMLSILETFGMNCPKCTKEKIFSSCNVKVSSQFILDKITTYESNVMRLDDEIEYRLIDFLNQHSDKTYSADEISHELDCSRQLISKRAEKLIGKSLVTADSEKYNGRKYYTITETAVKALSNN